MGMSQQLKKVIAVLEQALKQRWKVHHGNFLAFTCECTGFNCFHQGPIAIQPFQSDFHSFFGMFPTVQWRAAFLLHQCQDITQSFTTQVRQVPPELFQLSQLGWPWWLIFHETMAVKRTITNLKSYAGILLGYHKLLATWLIVKNCVPGQHKMVTKLMFTKETWRRTSKLGSLGPANSKVFKKSGLQS